MRILKAGPGCVMTDGTTYGKTVCLADNADPADWSEISEARAEELQAKEAEQEAADEANE